MNIGKGNQPPTRERSLLLNRPMTSNALPTGDLSILGNGSLETPIDYWVEALPGECLLVARFIIHIVAATNVGPGEYGDLPTLINGIQLFYKRYVDDLDTFITFDISNGFPLRTHEDWGRWAFDAVPVPYGPTGNTPYFQARWTLTKYGSPWGITLQEGEQIGMRVRDPLSALADHTAISEGVHLGVPSLDWTLLL